MINNIIGEKTIDLSTIRSGKEVAVISVLSNNIQYQTILTCSHATETCRRQGQKREML